MEVTVWDVVHGRMCESGLSVTTCGVRHPGIVCRACKEPIYGARHKCIDCTDFDLCQHCISNVNIRFQHDYAHAFFPIEYPWDHNPFRAVSTGPFKPHRHSRCKGCQRSPIPGTRYECRSCLAFNFCVACYNSAEQRWSHPASHVFRLGRNDDEGPSLMTTWDDPRNKSASFECIDHKCMRRSEAACKACVGPEDHFCLDCSEYGLCTSCISKPEVRLAHDRTHRFAPVQCSSPMPYPSFRDQQEESATICGGCDRQLGSTTHHRCLECPAFVLCQSCISSVRARLSHDGRHCFFPIKHSSDSTEGAFATVFASLDIVRCGNCGAGRGTVQHRCLTCPDFTLCAKCAVDPKICAGHDAEHPFFPYTPKVGEGDPIFDARRKQLVAKESDTSVLLPGKLFGETTSSPTSIAPPSRMFFVVPETSICFSSDYVPWASASSVITIHGHIEKRSPTVLDDFWGSASDHFIAADCNRAMIWGVVHMVSLGLVSPQDIFQTSVSGGECYTLTPPVRSALPLQWIHIGPKAIPNVLADVSCQVMDAEDLLAKLNSVLGTSHSLDTPDLHELLVYALNTSRDFGEVYGMLRGSWPADGDFFLALDRITDRQAQVQRRRDNAQRGTAIEDSEIHPRRIWDLYSNRVLPFHAMLRELYNGNKKMPAVLWTISHSWVEEARRANVNTTINGMQWLVPVPVDTSLENVRIELLNMGAEYVWLDVLCLRQVDDEIRLKEWGLDIPTIGHIFQASPKDRPCVTYFNGLGLPLDMSKATCESNRHWFQRVWTLQESLVNWLPGGLVLCKEADDEDKIFARLDRLLSSVAGWDGLPAVIRTIGERSCTTELDRVAGLARYLRCATLPIYDRAASVEKAWTALLKHMHELPRTALFVQYAADTPFAPWPSWAALLAERPVLPYSAFEMPMSEMFRLDCKLYLVDQVLLYTSRPGRYWHEGHAVGPFHATLDAPAANGEHLLHMHFSPGTTKTGVETFSVPVIAQHGIILPNVPYTLVGMGPPGAATYWVVTEVVGEQRLRNDTALTVVKWGVLYIDKKDGGLLGKLQPDRITKQVVYLSGEEALTKSAYVEEYLQAFSRERSGGTE